MAVTGQAGKVLGKNILIFVSGKAIALTTDTTLSFDSELGDSSTKDDGTFDKQEIVKQSWSATNDSFFSADKDRTVDAAGVDLVDAYMRAELVDVLIGTPANAGGELPEGGWSEPATAGFGYKGKAYITQIEIKATNGEKATCSLTLQGYGMLEKV